MAQLRILYVNTVRPGYDGLTLFTLKYLRAMDLSGLRVGYVFIAEPPAPIRAALEALGVEVFVIPRIEQPARYVARLARLVRRARFDIVHAHGNSATLLLEMLGAFLGGARVRIAHSHNTASNSALLHRLLGPAFNALATARMACGTDAGRWLFGARPFEVVPVASDAEEYRFDAARRARARCALGVPEDAPLVGCAAGFVPAKNHLFLLEAFAAALSRRPALRLMLMGDGPLRAGAEDEAARLGIADAVVFAGAVDDVPARMQALDALALPSLHEGFPNVLVEAQMAGLPALVSDRVTRECDFTGLLTFLPLDIRAWADALAALAPIDRAAASARGRERAAEAGYEVRVQAAKLRKRYESLAAKPRG